MKKVWLVFVITGCLIVGFIPPSTAQALSNFKDYNQVGDQYRESMNYLVESGVFIGYDGRINPKGELTRAEVAKMIAVLVGAVQPREIVAPVASTKFKDLKNHWVSGYVEKLMKFNPSIISGIPEGLFKPDDLVKKDELAKIVVTAFSIPLSNSVQVVDGPTSWAKKEINALASAGIIPSGIFSPKSVPTREFTSLLMQRAKEETTRLVVNSNGPMEYSADKIAERLGVEVTNSYRYLHNGTFGTQTSISISNQGLTNGGLDRFATTLVDFEIEVKNQRLSNTGTYEIYLPLFKKSYILHLKEGEKFHLLKRLSLSEQEKKLVTGAWLTNEPFLIQFHPFTKKNEYTENSREIYVTPVLINGNQQIPVGEKQSMYHFSQPYLKTEFLHQLVTYQYSYDNGTFYFGNSKDNFNKYAEFLGSHQSDIIRYGKELYATHTLDAAIRLSKGTGSVQLQLNYLGKSHTITLKEHPTDYANYYLSDLFDLTSEHYLLSNLQGQVTFKLIPLNKQKGSAIITLYATDKNKQPIQLPLSEYLAY